MKKGPLVQIDVLIERCRQYVDTALIMREDTETDLPNVTQSVDTLK